MNFFRRFHKTTPETKNEVSSEFWDRLHTHTLEAFDLKDLLNFSIESTITAKPQTGQIKYFSGTESTAHSKNVFIEANTIRLHTHGVNQIAAISPGDFELPERDIPEILANKDGISIFSYPKTNGIDSEPLDKNEEMWDVVSEFARKVHGVNGLISIDANQEVGEGKINEICRDFGLKSGGILKEIPWNSDDINLVLDLINGNIGINEFLYKLNIEWKIV